ncbi:MAG: non-homologous end-joining DNA ligase [Bacillota bacterium]
MNQEQTVTIAGRRMVLTNPHKVLWPAPSFTKGDMIEYYVRVAPLMLPHLADRPLVLTRYPDGVDGEWFYQKDCPEYAPPWVETFEFYAKSADRSIAFILARDAADLAWLANQAAIEIHPWLSRYDEPERPDFAIFDLDPSPPADFKWVVEVAFIIKGLLDRLGLRAYPKTSGATGLHIYLPVKRLYSYPDLARFVAAVADLIRSDRPDLTTRERTVAKRRGVYIDHLQNVLGKTIAAPYSLRPTPVATVSTPVRWDELPGLDPKDFNIRTVLQRFERVGDLFAPVISDKQVLTGIMDGTMHSDRIKQ